MRAKDEIFLIAVGAFLTCLVNLAIHVLSMPRGYP